MAKGKTRKEKKRLIFISITIVALVISLITSLYSDFIDILNNKKITSMLTLQYQDLLDEQDKLSSEVIKMQDPDYVARYAKEKYMYSSQGEIIIRVD